MIIIKSIVSGIAGLLVVALFAIVTTSKGKYDSKTTGMVYALCALLTTMTVLIWT